MPKSSNNKGGKQRKQRMQPYSRQRSIVPNQLYSSGFPRQTKVSLHYTETINITLTTSVAFDYLFNLNSIFDPNRSGTGHQPYAHDQWANFYGRYRVDQVRAYITPLGSTTNNVGQKYTMFPSNSVTGLTAYDTASEQPFATQGFCIPYAASRPFSGNYNLAEVTGVQKSIYENDDRYQSTFGSSPSEILALHVVIEDGSFSNPSVYWNITLEMDTTMFDPIQLGQS